MKKLIKITKAKSQPKTWRKVKLGEVLEKVIDNRGKNPLFTAKGYEVIETYQLSRFNKYPIIDESKQKYVSKETYNSWFRSGHPKGGDILFSTVGSLIPQYNLVPNGVNWCIAQNIVGLRADKSKIIPEFLFAYLRQETFFKKIKGIIIGGAQPSIKVPHLLDLEIDLPSLGDQKRIARILSVFDEKIELNNKINQTLEQMAQAIFKEWFAAPAEALAKVGKLPREWRFGYLGDGFCSEIIKPGIENFEGQKIYLATADVARNKIVNDKNLINYEGRPGRANMQPVLNSIWFAKMINTYKVLFFFNGNKEDLNKYILSTGFAGIKALNNFQYYLYLFINLNKFHTIKDTLVQGAVQEAITNTNIKQIQLIIPPSERILAFNRKIDVLMKKIFKNEKENQTLASLRDLLLPKLMSGKIKV